MSARDLIEAEDPKQFMSNVAPTLGEPSWCGVCQWEGRPTVTFPAIPDLLDRLDIGGEVPSGECPECGALCYLRREHGA